MFQVIYVGVLLASE
jgi:hypothetical protein